MKNKIRVLTRIGVAIGMMMAMGCSMELETQVKKAGSTGLNDIYASAARVRNPLGQEAIAIEIHAEAKTPPVAYRREVVTMNGNGAAAPAAAPKYVVPATSPRGKKANIVVAPPPVKQAPPPAPPTTVIREEGYYPSTIPLATAGGVGAGFLQTWGNALFGSAPIAAGMMGGAALLRPARTSISQTGGGASQTQGQGQVSNNANLNANQNNNNNAANANASSASSAASSAAAAAAAGN